MRIVVALGGNALLERKDRPDADVERRHIRETLKHTEWNKSRAARRLDIDRMTVNRFGDE